MINAGFKSLRSLDLSWVERKIVFIDTNMKAFWSNCNRLPKFLLSLLRNLTYFALTEFDIISGAKVKATGGAHAQLFVQDTWQIEKE